MTNVTNEGRVDLDILRAVTALGVQVGTNCDAPSGRVDGDAVIAFALATNDPNERYLRGEAVPPLYTSTFILQANSDAQREWVDADQIKGARGSVHGAHDVHFCAPVRPGMAVRWDTTPYGVRQTPGGVQVTLRIVVSDLEGTPLVEHYWSGFHIGATLEDDLGAVPPDHTFPPGARARRIGAQTVPVDLDQGFRYAGVSGDHIGHAIDDEAARREGFPSKILQGLCTFGLCSGAVVNVGANGDPDRLRRLAGRFSAPAFPRRDIVVDLYDAGRSADGGRVLAFEATQNGVTVIKHGRAELLPD